MNFRMVLMLLCMLLAGSAGMAQLQPITYNDGNQKLIGQLAKPKKAHDKKAGILILPAWMGIDKHSKEVAQQLSDSGYTAFIADIYGEGNYPASKKEAGERSGYYKQHPDDYHKRIDLALKQLFQAGIPPEEIVIIGYCFGGLGAIEAARVNMPVKGIISFHGSYGRDASRDIQNIKPKMLILHGADDPNAPQEELIAFQDELRKAKADWQINYYGNAVHAFTEPSAGNDNSKGAAYNAEADKRSWQAMLQFLNELFNE